MFKFWAKPTKNIRTIVKEQLKQNRAVFESLRDYDAGKKEISTTNIRKHLRNLQNTPQ